jgi:Rv2632c-like
MHTKTWHVEVYLYEHEGTTRAEAVLRTDAGTELRHEGAARKNPGDRDIPEIGDELAACRALSGLAHDLLEATIADVQANDPATGEPEISIDAE